MRRQEILNLFNEREKKLSSFSKSLKVNEEYQILGVKTIEIRKIAKKLSKEEGVYLLDDFFEMKETPYYEEVLLMYFLYLNLSKKMEKDVKFNYLDKLLEYNNSWATNDALVTTLCIKDKDKEEYWNYLLEKVKSENPYDKRFMIVSFMSYFLDDKYTKKGLDIITGIDSNHYYVNMAIAWALATSFAKKREITYPYLFEMDDLNPQFLKKAINKSIESFRISDEDKILLKKRRAKLKLNIVEF